MDGCVYRTKDGECDLYSECGKFHAFCCKMNSCEGRKMSNYDRIVSKSPEELARWIWAVQSGIEHEDIVSTYGWKDWLRQEVQDGT